MFGLKVDRLLKEDVQKLEPNVEVNVAGAVLFKDDCHFHPGKMMVALKNYLLSTGVKLELDCTVTGFEKANKKVSLQKARILFSN